MKIIQVKISDLKPAEYNPRKISKEDYDQLKTSISEFGCVDPIIVNENSERQNIVIGGHQRLKVMKDLKFKEVPVFYVNLDSKKEKELNIRLNKNQGEWDFDLLKLNFELEDLKKLGFDDFDLNRFEVGQNKEIKLDNFNENLIIKLEYTQEDYVKVIEKFNEIGGTPEKIVFDFLFS